MIKIDKCFECKNIYHLLFKNCPIWKEIQDGMELINLAMVKALRQDEQTSPKFISVVSEGHWLAKCDFECNYFQQREDDKKNNS